VKQKRALLKSNPLGDNWKRRRNKNVSIFGEAKRLPRNSLETFILEPPNALKNLGPGISRLF
jgi:hypothetical protein